MAKQVQGKPRAATGTAPSEGRSVSTPTPSGTDGLPHSPGDYPIFVFKSHPIRWQLMGDELLPVLGHIKLVPGLNCVTETGDWSMAKARAEAEGWTVIPYEVLDGGYVREHDSGKKDVHGNKLHIYTSCFEKPYSVAGRPEMETNADGYREFLRGLIAIGMVQLPPPQFLDKFADRVRQRLVDLAAAGINKPGQKDAADATLLAIDKMKAQLETSPGVYETYTGPKIELSGAKPDPKVAIPKSGGRKVASPPEEGSEAEP